MITLKDKQTTDSSLDNMYDTKVLIYDIFHLNQCSYIYWLTNAVTTRKSLTATNQRDVYIHMCSLHICHPCMR